MANKTYADARTADEAGILAEPIYVFSVSAQNDETIDPPYKLDCVYAERNSARVIYKGKRRQVYSRRMQSGVYRLKVVFV
jgi:hypothetical protein